MCCIIVTRSGEPAGIKAYFLGVLGRYLPSGILHDWLGYLTYKTCSRTYNVHAGTFNLTHLQLHGLAMVICPSVPLSVCCTCGL